jgi:hypothetical protein
VAFEAIDDTAVGSEREALGRDGWPSHVAAEVLESLELASGHEHLSVQGQAAVVVAQRAGMQRRVELAQARERRRAPGRKRSAVLDRRGGISEDIFFRMYGVE